MENIVEKRRNCSWGAISPLFHNIFNISLTSKVQLPISLLNVVNQIIFSSILQTWYVELRISRSISESPLEFEITRVDCTYKSVDFLRLSSSMAMYVLFHNKTNTLMYIFTANASPTSQTTVSANLIFRGQTKVIKVKVNFQSLTEFGAFAENTRFNTDCAPRSGDIGHISRNIWMWWFKLFATTETNFTEKRCSMGI